MCIKMRTSLFIRDLGNIDNLTSGAIMFPRPLYQ